MELKGLIRRATRSVSRPFARRSNWLAVGCLIGLVWIPSVLAASWPSRVEDGGSLTDAGLPSYYAQTAWPALHRDARNSDFVPLVAPANNRVRWTALDGAMILVAPTIGPEGNIYITTGRGPGTSHLHAFNRAGNLLWESLAQVDQNDLDAYALTSSPVIDVDGDVYVGDGNQFWAFHPDGALKWVTELPEPDSPFLSAIITQQGFIGGITVNGKVVLYRREDGSPTVPVLDLPGGSGLAPPPIPPGLWQGGLLDPVLLERVWAVFLGFGGEVAVTPVVHPTTGRIYVVAAGATPDVGALYGIDIVDGRLEIAFQTTFAGGSGSSPAISPDGTLVCTADGNEVLIAIDAETGALRWQAGGAQSAASPGVGPDGTIYAGGGTVLTAFNPEDGSVRWSANYDAVAASLLPQLPSVPPFLTSGDPIARVDSVVSISATRVWIVLILGYDVFIPPEKVSVLQPRRVVLMAVRPEDGSVVGSPTTVRDTSEAVITINSDGRLYLTHGALLTSIWFYGINSLLPEFLRIPGPPLAGITALEPASFVEHVREGIRWVQELDTMALDQLPGGELDAAFTATRRGRVQLGATAVSILDAQDRGELDANTAISARTLLLDAQSHLTAARDLLGQAVVTLKDQAAAATEIVQADAALSDALALLPRVTTPPLVGNPSLQPPSIRPVGGWGIYAGPHPLLGIGLIIILLGSFVGGAAIVRLLATQIWPK